MAGFFYGDKLGYWKAC